MTPNPLFLLRMGTLLGSATLHLVTADPRGFADKVAERIPLADGAISQRRHEQQVHSAASTPGKPAPAT